MSECEYISFSQLRELNAERLLKALEVVRQHDITPKEELMLQSFEERWTGRELAERLGSTDALVTKMKPQVLKKVKLFCWRELNRTCLTRKLGELLDPEQFMYLMLVERRMTQADICAQMEKTPWYVYSCTQDVMEVLRTSDDPIVNEYYNVFLKGLIHERYFMKQPVYEEEENEEET